MIDRTLLQVLGKYLAFFAATLFVVTLAYLCIGWFTIPTTDRLRAPVLTYYAMLTAVASFLLLSGLALRFRRPLLGIGFILVSIAVFAWGMPDR
ncbi:hypothetical protein [Anatilimnocola floriformis]|uniref:hypothetical protein n=1 Tax=Anatilimnocola floriformis TaxID=2948575 RepID=UPI0020C4444C|nr:hypothetical protein [Anatilimnocola floriformis]